jgi:hypothetical protein
VWIGAAAFQEHPPHADLDPRRDLEDPQADGAQDQDPAAAITVERAAVEIGHDVAGLPGNGCFFSVRNAG